MSDTTELMRLRDELADARHEILTLREERDALTAKLAVVDKKAAKAAAKAHERALDRLYEGVPCAWEEADEGHAWLFEALDAKGKRVDCWAVWFAPKGDRDYDLRDKSPCVFACEYDRPSDEDDRRGHWYGTDDGKVTTPEQARAWGERFVADRGGDGGAARLVTADEAADSERW